MMAFVEPAMPTHLMAILGAIQVGKHPTNDALPRSTLSQGGCGDGTCLEGARGVFVAFEEDGVVVSLLINTGVADSVVEGTLLFSAGGVGGLCVTGDFPTHASGRLLGLHRLSPTACFALQRLFASRPQHRNSLTAWRFLHGRLQFTLVKAPASPLPLATHNCCQARLFIQGPRNSGHPCPGTTQGKQEQWQQGNAIYQPEVLPGRRQYQRPPSFPGVTSGALVV